MPGLQLKNEVNRFEVAVWGDRGQTVKPSDGFLFYDFAATKYVLSLHMPDNMHFAHVIRTLSV